MRVWIGGVLASALLSGAASAQSTFHVKEFDYEQGKWVFETINADQGGYGARSPRIQWGHELGLGYAVTGWWLPKVLISFDKLEHDSYELQRLMFENVLLLKPLELGKTASYGVAWFQSVEGALDARQTNGTTFGPIFTAEAGRLSFSSNTFFERTFGQNSTPGLNFLLAWQARYQLIDTVKIGLEGYTFVPEVGASHPTPGTGVLNRIGPVLILDFALPGSVGTPRGSGQGPAGVGRNVISAPAMGTGAQAELELGLLVGTTDYTPDLTGKANMHIKF